MNSYSCRSSHAVVDTNAYILSMGTYIVGHISTVHRNAISAAATVEYTSDVCSYWHTTTVARLGMSSWPMYGVRITRHFQDNSERFGLVSYSDGKINLK